MHQSILKIKFKKKCIIKKNVVIDKNVKLEGGNKICMNSQVLNSSIGFGTYIGENCFIKNTKIGRYSCLAKNIITISGAHPSSKFVSIHPAFYSIAKQSGFTYVRKNKFEEFKYIDKKNRISVIIGNDVWIGEGVKIMEGVTIGDGAIIAAGSIVTKNIKEYSVVGGIPARYIKSRFTEKEIKFLLDLKWWDRGKEWINTNADKFEDIEILINNLL
ncbi:CatB-related O-acetyltransferase [Clostridium perfringens]